jgi:hypothetical protein
VSQVVADRRGRGLDILMVDLPRLYRPVFTRTPRFSKMSRPHCSGSRWRAGPFVKSAGRETESRVRRLRTGFCFCTACAFLCYGPHPQAIRVSLVNAQHSLSTLSPLPQPAKQSPIWCTYWASRSSLGQVLVGILQSSPRMPWPGTNT